MVSKDIQCADHATTLNMLRIDVTVKNVMINGEVFP